MEIVGYGSLLTDSAVAGPVGKQAEIRSGLFRKSKQPTTWMARSDESKYTHLLQPIRDLAGNWDINIADELEEYLVGFPTEPKPSSAAVCIYPQAQILLAFTLLLQEVLESVTFSFEDGPSLNFAEGKPRLRLGQD